MKVVLYMAVAANGMIAMNQGATPWGEASWENFISAVERHQNLVIGRTTYEVMKDEGSLELLRGDPKIIVVSGSATNLTDAIAVKSPNAALGELEGQSVALIGGGARLATSFISNNLLDEIHLDVEPILIGKGMELLTEELTRKLKLISIDRYDVGFTIKYKVEKSNE